MMRSVLVLVIGGGGPLIVHNVGEYGRLDLKHPTINVQKAQILDFDFNPFKDNCIATGTTCRVVSGVDAVAFFQL